MVAREQRVAKNQTLFREVNERIKGVNAEVPLEEETDFLCECGNEDCTEPVSLSLAEYEHVRSGPTLFAIVPGHQTVDIEHVVSQNTRYAVVEKDAPLAARIAVEQDPRA
jgi:hypothetical protein